MKKAIALTLIGLWLLPLAAQAQYRWRDADGKMGFGDEPPPGASAVERWIAELPRLLDHARPPKN